MEGVLEVYEFAAADTRIKKGARSLLTKDMTARILDYIYEHGGEPTVSSRKGTKFERHCAWCLYKEHHLVEYFFQKLKAYRRIAARYEKLACTYLGFLCIASILVWIK